MKYRELLKRLREDGWYQVSQEGSHRQFKHPTKPGKGDRSRSSEARRAARNAEQHTKLGRAKPKTMKFGPYLIVIEKANGNFGAYAPDIPGCGALGDTLEETVRNMKKALEMHITAMRADGEPIPEPSTVGDYIEVPEPAKRKSA